MIRIEIDHEMLRTACLRSLEMGKIKHSFMQGNRSLIGFLGEEIFMKYRPQARLQDTYDYDFEINGFKVDIKSRIGFTDPKPEHEHIIHTLKQDQDVDVYVISAVINHLTHGWLLGYVYSKTLHNYEMVKAGDPMPQGGFYRAGGYRIKNKQLERFK